MLKKIMLATVLALMSFGTVYAHEDLHDFEVTLTVRGAPVVVYKVNQVPMRLADVLCSTLTAQVQAWKTSPTTDPLILDGIHGKITLFEKAVVDSVHCKDITPQKEHAKEKKEDKGCGCKDKPKAPENHWVLVAQPDYCGRLKYTWIYR